MSEDSNKKPNWDRDKEDMLRNGSQPLVRVPMAPPIASPGPSAEEQDAYLRRVGLK